LENAPSLQQTIQATLAPSRLLLPYCCQKPRCRYRGVSCVSDDSPANSGICGALDRTRTCDLLIRSQPWAICAHRHPRPQRAIFQVLLEVARQAEPLQSATTLGLVVVPVVVRYVRPFKRHSRRAGMVPRLATTLIRTSRLRIDVCLIFGRAPRVPTTAVPALAKNRSSVTTEAFVPSFCEHSWRKRADYRRKPLTDRSRLPKIV
jgi:hypothetical protein